MMTRAHILDQRQLDWRYSDDPRVVIVDSSRVDESRIKITTDPTSDRNVACEHLIVNARQARVIAYLLCEAADKLEAL